ncbi:hypothetical protein WMY93_018050 [Mugilogobius chulae]|uniref:Uncharacterized protein n=1 Tax=Mugilogobius chulae TaxID=88201 RepID=A0AAW0NI01_9GOBI
MDSRAPQKPWERRIPGAMATPVNYRSTDFTTALPASPAPGPPALTRMAPPLPPRPVQQSYRPQYSSFTSSYGAPYGSSSFYTPGYSPYATARATATAATGTDDFSLIQRRSHRAALSSRPKKAAEERSSL